MEELTQESLISDFSVIPKYGALIKGNKLWEAQRVWLL
jgi:hypothetical protein